MKVVAVTPGKPNSVHLGELPKPRVDEVPSGWMTRRRSRCLSKRRRGDQFAF
jgi:hypothetical protein